MDKLFTDATAHIVPQAVNAAAGAAVSNPYTAAAVGVVVAGLAGAKYVDMARPNVAAAGRMARSFGRNLRRKLHAMTAEDAVPTNTRMAMAAE